MIKILDKFNFLLKKGLFHILGTSIINNIIQFFTNIFIVNLVSKSDFGVYSYANNIMNFFLLLRGLGLTSGLIQFGSESRINSKRKEIYNFVLVKGSIYNVILSIFFLIYVSISNFQFNEAKGYLLAMLFVPFFQWMFDYVTTIFRIKQENIKYARLMNINTVLYFIFSVLGANYLSVVGVILARYFSFIVSIFIAFYWLRDDFHDFKLFDYGKYKEKKECVKYSFTACITNSLSELLYLLDVFLIGIFVANADSIAAYKVATQIPTALGFIPIGIITFIYPYFANHNKDMKWIKEKSFKLIGSLALINGVICLLLYIFSPLIIKILWGSEYMDSLVPLRILSINFFFLGTFKIPVGNILAILRKVKINLITSVISGIANIILDIIFIQYFGSLGAALATLLVVFINISISLPYLCFCTAKQNKI